MGAEIIIISITRMPYMLLGTRPVPFLAYRGQLFYLDDANSGERLLILANTMNYWTPLIFGVSHTCIVKLSPPHKVPLCTITLHKECHRSKCRDQRLTQIQSTKQFTMYFNYIIVPQPRGSSTNLLMNVEKLFLCWKCL